MIILLDDDIHKKISDNTLSNIEIECLSSLALSKKRGYNFVIASRPLLMSLSKYDKFSDQTKYTYQTIYHDQTRWFRLLSQFKFIIKLSSLAQEMNSTNLNDYITLTIPLKFFLDYSIDKKATIIAEHYSDIKLYKEMARSYLNHRKIKGISLTCSEALGGGSTTCEVVMNYLENFESISLCIVDSDLKSPWSGYGETATKVNGLKLSNDYARYLITKSREAENIIPTKLLLDIFDKNKAQKNKVTKYKKIREYLINGESPIKYVDFKKGIKLSQATCLECDKYKDYWTSALKACDLYKNCPTLEQCKDVKKCTSVIVDGFGTDLLKKCAEHLEKNGFQFNDIDEDSIDEWNYICENIVPYMVSPIAKLA